MSQVIANRWVVVRTAIVEAARWLLFVAVVLLLLAKGGVPFPSSEAVAVVVGLVLALSAVEPERNPALLSMQRRTLVFVVLLLAYTFAQTIDLPAFGNAVWSTIESEFGGSPHHGISVAPGQWPWAALRMALPYAVFLAAISLVQFESHVAQLWRALAALGTAFAVYGMAQLALFPDWLLYGEKLHYREWLTGVLVNRNNAATFLGLTLIATIGVVWQKPHSPPRSQPLFRIGERGIHRREVGWLAAGFLQMLAIGLTGSRGGLAATVAGLCVLAALLVDTTPLRRRLSPTRYYTALIGIGLMIGAAAVLAAALLGGRTLYRLGTIDNSGRLCAFRSTLDAAYANLPFGSGLGSFRSVFPAYRGLDCGSSGIWEMAHNSYLENFLELGLPYFVFLAVGLWIVARALRTGLRNRREYRVVVAGGIAATVLVSAHALVDFSLQIPAIAATYALILATAVTISLGRTRRRSPTVYPAR